MKALSLILAAVAWLCAPMTACLAAGASGQLYFVVRGMAAVPLEVFCSGSGDETEMLTIPSAEWVGKDDAPKNRRRVSHEVAPVLSSEPVIGERMWYLSDIAMGSWQLLHVSVSRIDDNLLAWAQHNEGLCFRATTKSAFFDSQSNLLDRGWHVTNACDVNSAVQQQEALVSFAFVEAPQWVLVSRGVNGDERTHDVDDDPWFIPKAGVAGGNGHCFQGGSGAHLGMHKRDLIGFLGLVDRILSHFQLPASDVCLFPGETSGKSCGHGGDHDKNEAKSSEYTLYAGPERGSIGGVCTAPLLTGIVVILVWIGLAVGAAWTGYYVLPERPGDAIAIVGAIIFFGYLSAFAVIKYASACT